MKRIKKKKLNDKKRVREKQKMKKKNVKKSGLRSILQDF